MTYQRQWQEHECSGQNEERKSYSKSLCYTIVFVVEIECIGCHRNATPTRLPALQLGLQIVLFPKMRRWILVGLLVGHQNKGNRPCI